MLMDQQHSPGDSKHSADESNIAIIGMAGRFPGADNVETFWRNISTGVESFTRFSNEELIDAGVSAATFQQAKYVMSRPILEDIRGFDAGFFGYNPREATLADPQQRIFLEVAWEVLEAAGYGSPDSRGSVGVFAGPNISGYLLTRLRAFEMGIDPSALMIGNDKDALTTNVSFRLNLSGPSAAVQTFCSTSLLAAPPALPPPQPAGPERGRRAFLPDRPRRRAPGGRRPAPRRLRDPPGRRRGRSSRT